MPRMWNLRAIGTGALLGLCAGVPPGCVERKITIGSEPAGALVLLNDVEVGRTPVTVPFKWYGDYDVRIRLERNEGTAEKPDIHHYYLHTSKTTTIPWFEIFGVDLFAELLPIPFKDEQVWAFPVPAVTEPTDDDLIARARSMKGELDKPDELQKKK